MHILPAALSNVEAALRAQLNQSILKYIPSIGGVPLAYTDLRVLKPLGLIRDELPHIFVPVEVRVLAFRPQVGTLLEGIVTRSSREVLSVLVLSVFTASVAAKDVHPHAKEGDRVRFTVSGVGVANDLITLTGVDPVVTASEAGASRSASRSKSHNKRALGSSGEKAAAPAEPAAREGAHSTDREASVKRKKHGASRSAAS